MFENTRQALDKIVKELKFIVNAVTFCSQVGYLLYLAYALLSGMGNVYINCFLFAVSLFYFVFNLIVRNKKSKAIKKAQFATAHSIKWSKLAINAFTLGTTLYVFYTSSANGGPNAFNIVITTLLLLMWILQVLLEIILLLFEREKNVLVAALEKDIEPLKQKLTVVVGKVTKVKQVVDKITFPFRRKKKPVDGKQLPLVVQDEQLAITDQTDSQNNNGKKPKKTFLWFRKK